MNDLDQSNMPTLNEPCIDALGPRQRKNLESIVREAYRTLDSHIQEYPDGAQMILWAPFGGGPQDPAARAAQTKAWDSALDLCLKHYGHVSAKNRVHWERELEAALRTMRNHLPIILK